MINGELIVDNFAAGGGASTGIEMATGISVDIAIERLGKHREWGWNETTEEAIEVAITALKEIQQYRAMQSDIIKNNAELLEYRAIGTVEECREAVDKQKAKKPLKGGNTDRLQGDIYICVNCSKVVRIDDCGCFYCPDCGQRIDWRE